MNTVQTPVPGLTSSVNTLNTSIQVQGPYAGSVAGTAKPFSGKLSLREAVARGLEYNLGAEGLTQAMRQARGQARVARSFAAAEFERLPAGDRGAGKPGRLGPAHPRSHSRLYDSLPSWDLSTITICGPH